MSMAASGSGRPSDGAATRPLYKGLDVVTQLVNRGPSLYFWSAKFKPRLFPNFACICLL